VQFDKFIVRRRAGGLELADDDRVRNNRTRWLLQAEIFARICDCSRLFGRK
jgi:hypothetical protein